MQRIFVFPVLQRCTDQKTGWNHQAKGKENALTETFGSGKTRCRPVKEQKPETNKSYSIGDDESQTLGDILEIKINPGHEHHQDDSNFLESRED